MSSALYFTTPRSVIHPPASPSEGSRETESKGASEWEFCGEFTTRLKGWTTSNALDNVPFHVYPKCYPLLLYPPYSLSTLGGRTFVLGVLFYIELIKSIFRRPLPSYIHTPALYSNLYGHIQRNLLQISLRTSEDRGVLSPSWHGS